MEEFEVWIVPIEGGLIIHCRSWTFHCLRCACNPVVTGLQMMTSIQVSTLLEPRSITSPMDESVADKHHLQRSP